MRILLANYRYFISSGPERYLFNVKDELESRTHEVVPFSVKYHNNLENDCSSYFVSPIGNDRQVYFSQQNKNIKTIYKTLSRNFYSKEVEKAVIRLIDDRDPQIAYILKYLRKLSPSLLVGLKKRGIPIVVRISDYEMVCPQGHCTLNDSPCELCLNSNLTNSIINKCVKNSYIASLVNYTSTTFHRYKGYFDLIDKYIVTNNFMYNIMKNSGYDKRKLVIIPTFTNIDLFNNNKSRIRNYVIYSGRLEHLKGLHVLLKSIVILNKSGTQIKLKVAGTGEKEYIDYCKSILSEGGVSELVDFLGMVDSEQLTSLYEGAKLSIVPSLWYENLPNSILESYASGVPVVASSLGSLSDTIIENKTGKLFEANNPEDLASKIVLLLNNNEMLDKMSDYAREIAVNKYSPTTHIDKLMNVFDSLAKC